MDNKPHGREKKVGTGSASVGKGRKVGTGGPVGGSSQQGRPGMPDGGRSSGGFEPQRGPGGRGVGLLGLLAIFAFIPKKFRGIAIVAVIAILLFSFMSGGGDSAVPAAPTYSITPQNDSSVQSIDDSNMMFSSSGYPSLSDLFGSYGLFGRRAASYSGSAPSGSSAPVGSGGLLQGLPGTSGSHGDAQAHFHPEACGDAQAHFHPQAHQDAEAHRHPGPGAGGFPRQARDAHRRRQGHRHRHDLHVRHGP